MAEIKRRLLGVDYGDARTGLAVSDLLGMLANGIGYIKSPSKKEVAAEIVRYAKEYDVEKIVIGYPINMNGTLGPRAEKIDSLIALLGELCDIPVDKFDERLTTAAAHVILNETNIRAKKRKTVIDTLSAQIILQNYMDAHRGR
ncbi:MAG: Holliday junction resolvase RuvX [Clostridia bacterium]|nr:Holliday junction resolvase RuvX [Clostridia bacterium]